MPAYSFNDSHIRDGSFWPLVEACYARTWEDYDMPAHYHDRIEVMYVMKGWCYVHLYEYALDAVTENIRILRHRTERLGPGEFILLDGRVLHRLEVPETNYMLNAEFAIVENADAPLSLSKLIASSPVFAVLLNGRLRVVRGRDESGLLLYSLDQIVKEFSRASLKDQPLMDILIAELLLRVADSVRNSSIKENALSYARRAADYIDAHFCEDFHVSDAAREVGVAPAYLQRVFKQALGVTMVEYLNRLRVEQSKRLLVYTDESIMDVAVASGFNSRQHFFRVFNAVEGVSPQQFRQRNRARSGQQLYFFEDVEDHPYVPGAQGEVEAGK